MKTQISNKVKSIMDIYNDLQKKLELTLKECFELLFNSYPKLQSYSWNQYTPYYNDGDPCEFSVSFWWGECEINEDGMSKKEIEDYIELIEVDIKHMSEIPPNIFFELFGDHAQITYTRDGFEITEYHHD